MTLWFGSTSALADPTAVVETPRLACWKQVGLSSGPAMTDLPPLPDRPVARSRSSALR